MAKTKVKAGHYKVGEFEVIKDKSKWITYLDGTEVRSSKTLKEAEASINEEPKPEISKNSTTEKPSEIKIVSKVEESKEEINDDMIFEKAKRFGFRVIYDLELRGEVKTSKTETGYNFTIINFNKDNYENNISMIEKIEEKFIDYSYEISIEENHLNISISSLNINKLAA